MRFGAAPSSGIELGYAEITANFAPGVIAATDVPGLSITITERHLPYVVKFRAAMLSNGTASRYSYAQLVRDDDEVTLDTAQVYTVTANTGSIAICEKRVTAPVPGRPRTYKIQTVAVNAGAFPTITANAVQPAFITAVER